MLKRTLTIAVSGAALLAATAAAAQTGKIGGWTFYDVEEIQKVTYGGTSFSQNLANEYKKFATFEAYDMYDWIDAEHFAGKAKMAASGRDVQPEQVSDWRIPEQHVNDLSGARTRLMTALASGARTKAPQEAAVAQAKYDCWMEQQEENHQWDHIAACRNEFFAALDTLDERMKPQQTSTQSEKMPAPEPRMTEVRERTAVFFAFDKATLTGEAEQTIAALIDSIRNKDEIELRVAGHADRAGPSEYNMQLSQRRAQAVIEELRERGMRAVGLKDLNVVAKGESEPAVQTADGVAEEANRRVEIAVFAMQKQSAAGARQ